MRALVVGAALSGIAISKLLVKKGYEVYLTDIKAIKEKEELETLGIKVYDGGHPDLLKELSYDLVIKNPGIKYDTPFIKDLVDAGYTILNEIDVALSFVSRYRYAAITGTNGKTTTTTLLGEILKRGERKSFACGNIGLPVSEIVLDNGDDDIDLAIEIAAFQLIAAPHFHPLVSVCMNLTPDHIDYFHDLDAYYEAKMLVYKNQRDDDWFLLNIDDEKIIEHAKDIKCKVITFSLEKKADLMRDGDKITLFGKELFDVHDLRLPGKHNLYNAMVAACMAYKMGIATSDIKDAISKFKGVRHRLEYVDTIDGVAYYNDSKGTNPDATKVALSSFKEVILLAGGYDKKTGFKEIVPYLKHVKKMFVYGKTKYEIKKIYPEAVICEDLKEATLRAKDAAGSGDVILLSPMCASWDQFNNYEERGDYFVKLVESFRI